MRETEGSIETTRGVAKARVTVFYLPNDGGDLGSPGKQYLEHGHEIHMGERPSASRNVEMCVLLDDDRNRLSARANIRTAVLRFYVLLQGAGEDVNRSRHRQPTDDGLEVGQRFSARGSR
jgi:hypothetical protein